MSYGALWHLSITTHVQQLNSCVDQCNSKLHKVQGCKADGTSRSLSYRTTYTLRVVQLWDHGALPGGVCIQVYVAWTGA